MTKFFGQDALETLQELAREPVGSIDELKRLQRQIQSAILLIESGDMVSMTEQERLEHANRFGPGAFVVGDFVITKR